jgi:hypothetical protein
MGKRRPHATSTTSPGASSPLPPPSSQVAAALRTGAKNCRFSSAVARARAVGVATGPLCSTATARVAAELASPVSAAPHRAASSSAVGRPVPPPRDDAPPRRRARAGAWALCSGHLACWAVSHRALGHEPARRTGRARQDRGPRALCKLGRATLCKRAASELWPWAACCCATGPRRIRPGGIQIVLLFSEYILIIAN